MRVLVCDASWTPHHWATWQEAVTQKWKGNIIKEIGDVSVFHGGISRATGKRTIIDVGQIIFLKDVLHYESRVPPLTNENLFARDLNLCAYCGRFYHAHKLSRDHVQPISKGGKNTWKNCVTACKSCNHVKADLPLGKARNSNGDLMELLYVPYTPTHAEHLIMQGRNILADQMDFLKSQLPEHSRLLNVDKILGWVH